MTLLIQAGSLISITVQRVGLLRIIYSAVSFLSPEDTRSGLNIDQLASMLALRSARQRWQYWSSLAYVSGSRLGLSLAQKWLTKRRPGSSPSGSGAAHAIEATVESTEKLQISRPGPLAPFFWVVTQYIAVVGIAGH